MKDLSIIFWVALVSIATAVIMGAAAYLIDKNADRRDRRS